MIMLLEYIVVFVIVLIINLVINSKTIINESDKQKKSKKVKKGKKDELPIELLYLKKIYHIDLNKINMLSVYRLCLFVNAFIISTIYIILMYLLDSWILRVIMGIVLLILMIIICYGIIGRYYMKKEGD